MERQIMNILPVKFRYIWPRGNNPGKIEVFYRKRGKHKLYSKTVPYQHYIYTEATPQQVHAGKIPVFRHLKNGRWYKREEMDTKRAKNTYAYYIDNTAEADLRPENRFVVDTYYDVDWPNDIKPRMFFYDIETEIVGQDLPSFTNHVANITAFTIYDTYTQTYFLRALVPSAYEYDSLESLQEQIEASLEEYDIRYDVKLVLDPKDIIYEIVNIFSTYPPDIITSWNSPFDIPYTVRKVYDELGEEGLKALSPFGTISWQVKEALKTGDELRKDDLIPGISVIDDLELYKKYSPTELVSYSLNSVSIAELGEGDSKLQYDTDFDTLYKQNFMYFCKYNLQDVRVMVLIEAKKKLLDLVTAVRNISKANYEHIFTESNIVDNMCLMKVVKWRELGKNWVLPSKPKNAAKEPYLGAFVKPTLVGRHKLVGDLDYKSMYPSIYDTWGLSNETIVGKIDQFNTVVKQGFDMYLRGIYYGENPGTSIAYEKSEFYLPLQEIGRTLMPNYKELHEEAARLGFSEYFYDSIDKEHSDDSSETKITITPRVMYQDIQTEFGSYAELREWCIENNYAIMGNGLIVDENVPEAFLGTLAGDTMDLRDTYKVVMKKYDAEGNEVMAMVYDIAQQAVKVINNSMYGVTATPSFRLFDVSIAEAITSTGQCIIKSSTYLVNKSLNSYRRKLEPNCDFTDMVITNDTDSIILTMQHLVKEEIKDTVEEYERIVGMINTLVRDVVNSEVKNIAKEVFFIKDTESKRFRLYIKNEWLAKTALFVAKKCYALNIVYKEGYPASKFEVKGMTLKKSSTPRIARDYLTNVVKKILAFASQEEVLRYIKDEAKRLEECDFEDLAYPTSVNGIDSYKKIPVHVRGAKIFNEYFAKSRQDRIVNCKVKYIYVGSWKTQQELNIKKEYVLSVPTNNKEYWDLLPSIIVPDYRTIREKLFVKPTESFFEALKWDTRQVDTIARDGAGVRSSFSFLPIIERVPKQHV